MRIIGIGTDIVKIERIKKLLEEYGNRFICRVLSPDERVCYKNNPAYAAKRFAGKEAVAKALGVGIGKHVAFTEISITNDTYGKPIVQLTGKATSLYADLKITRIFISLADENEYAQAFVVIEGE